MLSLIFIFAFPAKAIKKIEANPINIAVMLTQETDTASISFTLQYYGNSCGIQEKLKTDSSKPETYVTYTHPNSSIIRYRLSGREKYYTIEVISKLSTKEKDKILKNLNFQKKSNEYELKTIGHITRCVSSPNNTLIITRY